MNPILLTPPLGCADPGCFCKECVFTYKRWEHLPDDASDPDIVYKKTINNDTLHVSDYGFVLVGGSLVYSPYDAMSPHIAPEDMPALPDSNAEWLWISDNGSPSQTADSVFLYAVKAFAEQVDPTNSTFSYDVVTKLQVWRWDENTNTTTQIIDQQYLVLHGAGPAWQDGDQYAEHKYIGRIYLRNHASVGSFDNPPRCKLGDVRHGRIVIVGTATWYNEGTGAEYQYNSEVRCWDLDGVLRWSCNLGDFYSSDDIMVFAEIGATGYPAVIVPFPWDSQNNFAGYPYPLRVRIGEDKSVTVLTTYSRTPPEYGFKWSPISDDFGRYEDGTSAQPCVWRVKNDVTDDTSPTPATDFKVYGRSNGDVYTDIVFHRFEAGGPGVGDEALEPPKLTMDYNSSNDGFLLQWGVPTGGTPPYVYDVEEYDNATASWGTISPNATSPWDSGAIDLDVQHSYRIHITDSGGLERWSDVLQAQRKTYSVKLSSPRDMDVSGVGNPFLSARFSTGYGLIKTVYDPSVGTDTSATDPAGYRGDGFMEETAAFIYNEQTPEYAGPIWFDDYNDQFPEPAPPQTGDGTKAWILRAGENGTYLVAINLVNTPTFPYDVDRIWSCSYWPDLRLERAEYESTSTDSQVGQIHTMAFSGRVIEQDYPCPPCDPPVADPCSDCKDKTRKPAWQLIDTVLKDDAVTAHLNTKFMQCQLLQTGFVNNVLIDGVLTNSVPVFAEQCQANYLLYLSYPALFRQYTKPGEATNDCWWQLCGPFLKVCDVVYKAAEPGVPYIGCTASSFPVAAMGKELVGGEYKFRLNIYRIWIDLTTGIQYGPEIYVIYEAEDVSQICGPEATFTKILDNSAGEDPNLPYYGEPYFRDTVRAKRVVMETECDIPEPEPEPEFCPDDPEFVPGEVIYFEVGSSNQVFVTVDMEASDHPRELWLTSPNTWTGGFEFIRHNEPGSFCNPPRGNVVSVGVSVTWNGSTDPPDVNGVYLGWSLTFDYTYGDGSTSQHTTTNAPNHCPPFEISLIGAGGSFQHTDCVGNLVSFLFSGKFTPYVSPAIPSSTKVLVQKKTPEDLPCVFRGGYLNTVPCCGDLYQCKCPEWNKQKVRSCTIDSNHVQGVASCVSCPHRLEEGRSDQTSPSIPDGP